ncbi:hypothetical protein SISSUDRAFT_229062 [Sistotremastrum suecicum HHB10207 ss-3]|uniref:WD40 repeat-like protein n=1 Tax=Sistotremastrum suecicum HHB10207 ss-3 TaxID=1314776 RepID=A0A166A1Z0_9AGAM|nr:hypothetical protein SISSUDRAFT_229062 [Sistotremastrum suecicum HHB10207 ss-3]
MSKDYTYTFLVASSNTITIFRFTDPQADPTSEDPKGSRLKVPGIPNWIEKHPTHEFVFVSLDDGEDGKIAAIEFDQTGRDEKVVAKASTLGENPRQFWVGEDQIVIPNSAGPKGHELAQILFSPNDPFFGYAENPLISLPPIQDGTRQIKQVYQPIYRPKSDPETLELLVPDHGTDQIYRLYFDVDNQKWVPRAGPPDKVGSGHILVHDSFLYLISEKRCDLRIYEIDPVRITWRRTIPFPSGRVVRPTGAIRPKQNPHSTAEETWILVPYQSQSDCPLGDDTIAIFTTHPSSTAVGGVRPGLGNITSLRFSKDGKYLAVGGRDSVKIFEWIGKDVDEDKVKNKWLKEVKSIEIKNPTALLWFDLNAVTY